MVELKQKEEKDMPQILVHFCKVIYKPQRTIAQAIEKYDKNLEVSINPEITTTRYNKIWRFSLPQLHNKSFLIGKLGYTAIGVEKKTYYDEIKKDFIEQAVDSRLVSYSRWAIHLPTQLMAFEVKPNDIRYTAFINAFKDILDNSSDIGLTIEHMVQSAKFYEWANEIDKITRFAAHLRRPNPRFVKRTDALEVLLEKPNADSATVIINKSKESEDSLNLEDTIHDLVEYGEEGYSTITARGFKSGAPKQFDSRKETPSERIDIPPETPSDKIFGYIIEALRKFKR